MDIRKGNDVNAYFELSKLGVPSAESIKGIRCFFAKDVRSESGDVPVPPSCNPSSYVIHDHMHPGYNVHMPYRSITQHVHREFCVPDNCPPGWHGQTVFVVTDYKIVNIEKEGETVPYIRVTFGGDKQRNGRYNVVLEISYIGTDDQVRSDVKCTYDYGHQFDLTDQITALSGRIDIWLTDQKDIYTKVDELEKDLVQEISRSTAEDERIENAIQGIHGSIDDLQDETEDLYNKHSDQEDAIGELQDRATKLENVIPQEASAQNKLADKDYVNQHISENSATFRGTSAKGLTEQEFLDWANTLEKENNDYVFWDTVDGDSDTIFKRYKYNGQQWVYEYTVTSDNFTPAQWAAINSGLTSTDKQSLDRALNAIKNNITMSSTTFGRTDELSIQAGEISLHSEAPRFQYQSDANIRPDEISVSNVDTSNDVTTTSTAFVTPETVKFYQKQEQDGQPDVTREQSLTIDDVEKLHSLPTAVALNNALDSKADNSDISYIQKEVQQRPYVSNISVDTFNDYIDIVVPFAVGWGEDKDEERKLVSIEAATSTDAGLMSNSDKIKLDNLGTITDGSQIIQAAGENTTFVGAVSRLVQSLFYAMCPAGKFKGLYDVDNDYQVGEYVVNPDDMKLYVFTHVHYHGDGLAPNVNCEEAHLS